VYACGLTTSSTGATASATATAIVIPTPSIVQTAGDYQYTGCYTEATNGRALTGLHYINYQTMTVEICASFCGASFSMFGVEWSGEVSHPSFSCIQRSKCNVSVIAEMFWNLEASKSPTHSAISFVMAMHSNCKSSLFKLRIARMLIKNCVAVVQETD
jgi:hypothetical protein